MLQQFFKRMLRMTERKAVLATGQQHGLRMDGARPESERPTGGFLAQMLRSALTQWHAKSRGGRAVQQSPNDPPSNPGDQDTEQPDGKVVRLTPRRPAPERLPDPPQGNDDDPGPSAA